MKPARFLSPNEDRSSKQAGRTGAMNLSSLLHLESRSVQVINTTSFVSHLEFEFEFIRIGGHDMPSHQVVEEHSNRRQSKLHCRRGKVSRDILYVAGNNDWLYLLKTDVPGQPKYDAFQRPRGKSLKANR